MKQKIVIGVHMNCEKCRSKAMKIVSGANGVDSVAVDKKKHQVVVIGDGIDTVGLASLMRKKLGSGDLVSVAEVKPEAKKPAPEVKKLVEPQVLPWNSYYWQNPPQIYTYEVAYEGLYPNSQKQEDSCSIM